MKIYRYFAALCCLFVLTLLLTSYIVGKDSKKKVKNDVCSASNPASICSAENTCGSASSPCSIDIKRSQGTYATATPSIPGAKSNKAFCIKVGTTVTFASGSKNTGFVIDFGDSNPFDDEGAIMGGADRPITVTAKHPGCYTYSAGARTAGTIYGMCGQADTQLIISANQRFRSFDLTIRARTTTLFAALDMANGKVLTQCPPTKDCDSREFGVGDGNLA